MDIRKKWITCAQVGRMIACISYFFVFGKVLTDVSEWIRIYP